MLVKGKCKGMEKDENVNRQKVITDRNVIMYFWCTQEKITKVCDM